MFASEEHINLHSLCGSKMHNTIFSPVEVTEIEGQKRKHLVLVLNVSRNGVMIQIPIILTHVYAERFCVGQSLIQKSIGF